MSKIVAENLLEGSPTTQWDVVGIGSPGIQGFTTDISVNVGQTVSFKVSTAASDYRLDVYRMGYYGGLGARQVERLRPIVALPQLQPAAVHDPTTGLVDCGTWDVSAEWAVPPEAVSGIYFAKLVREDGIRVRATSCSSSATTTTRRTCCSRRPTRRGRPTTRTAIPACTTTCR